MSSLEAYPSLLLLLLVACSQPQLRSDVPTMTLSVDGVLGGRCTRVLADRWGQPGETRAVAAACEIEVRWLLQPGGEAAMHLDHALAARKPERKRVEASGVGAARARLMEPEEDDPWLVDVPLEAEPDIRLDSRWFVVFELWLETLDGSVRPFFMGVADDALDEYASDPGYCRHGMASISFFLGTDEPVSLRKQRGDYDKDPDLRFGDLFCSATDEGVFAVALPKSARSLSKIDVLVEVRDSVPRVFRLYPGTTDQLTEIEVTLPHPGR